MRVRWTPQARPDLIAISDYYRAEGSDLGELVSETAVAAARFLENYPEAGARYSAATRKWRIRRTPYFLIYRVDSGVEILRVRHAAEDRWRAA